MRAHEQEAMSLRFGTPEFRVRSVDDGDGNKVPDLRATCSYCGSITVDDMLAALSTSGTTYSGADWKYGWPQKFYVDIPCEPYERVVSSLWENSKVVHIHGVCRTRHHKFYSEHLTDATPEQIEAWNRVAAPLLGVKFKLDPEVGLEWVATRANHQAHGII